MLIEYVLRTSLIAAVVALVLYVMRIKTASARHAVWSGVVVVMLLLPAWLAWGPKARLPLLPPEAGQRLNQRPAPPPAYASQPSGAGLRPATHTKPQPPAIWDRGSLLAGIYLLGVCILLTRLAIGTLRTIRLTSTSCVVPVTVGFFRPRIILPESSSEWPQAKLNAVLIHEREHARRRDPLVQWIALLNRALFWFHPLAWWLERRLSALAEEACDAAVLAHGHDPHDYSETLLDLSRSVELAGTRPNVGMAMPGAALPQRIRRMLTGAPVPSISRPRLACTAVVCAAAVALLAAGTLVRAQSPSQPRPAFEVASVKPIDRATMHRDHEGHQLDGERFIDRTDLLTYIVQAYAPGDFCTMKVALGYNCPLISISPTVPAWVRTDRWEIQAKLPPNSLPSYTARQLRSGDTPQLNQMLQVLLEDRFQLKAHRETRDLPVYALTVGKSGPKLKQTPPKGDLIKTADGSLIEFHGLQGMLNVPSPDGTPRHRLSFQASSMREAAESFGRYLDRPVLDRTGLNGDYDFAIEYDADQTPAAPPAVDKTSGLGGNLFNPFTGLTGSALSAALQDVGLKLESTKAPVEVLVIDHVEKPSEN